MHSDDDREEPAPAPRYGSNTVIAVATGVGMPLIVALMGWLVHSVVDAGQTLAVIPGQIGNLSATVEELKKDFRLSRVEQDTKIGHAVDVATEVQREVDRLKTLEAMREQAEGSGSGPGGRFRTP